jgi:PAS domain S-box-containing protein
LVNKKGQICHVALDIAVISGTQRSVVSMFDITERKQAEEALRQTNRDLESSKAAALNLMEALKAENLARINSEDELRDAETRYRQLFEHSPDGIVILDPTTARPLEFNEAACRLLGYSREEFARLSIFDYEAVESPEETRAHIESVLREGRNDFETRQRTKQGEIRDIHVTAQIMMIQGRSVYHCIWRDITERKRMGEAVQASLREKETLLREIHHRVKNNMQVISSLLNLQAGHVADEEARRTLKESQLRIRSMALIHEKLYQTRDLSKIDFASYLQSLAAYLFQFFKVDADQIRLESDLEDVHLDINAAVPCGLLVNELISNALKYAFPGGRKGTVRIRLRQETDGTLKLRVADDGVGFPKELDFRHAESFGLQIVALLIEQLEGTIALEGNDGTAFAVAFRERAYKPRT